MVCKNICTILVNTIVCVYILPFKGSKLLYKLLRPTINLVFWLLSHNISNIGIKFDAWRERERERASLVHNHNLQKYIIYLSN